MEQEFPIQPELANTELYDLHIIKRFVNSKVHGSMVGDTVLVKTIDGYVNGVILEVLNDTHAVMRIEGTNDTRIIEPTQVITLSSWIKYLSDDEISGAFVYKEEDVNPKEPNLGTFEDCTFDIPKDGIKPIDWKSDAFRGCNFSHIQTPWGRIIFIPMTRTMKVGGKKLSRIGWLGLIAKERILRKSIVTGNTEIHQKKILVSSRQKTGHRKATRKTKKSSSLMDKEST
jgi:hypothetical protein